MPDKSVDAVVTDFPYGIGEKYASFDDTQDNLAILVSAVMPELLRVARVVLVTPGNGNQHLYPKPDWTLAWVERAGSGMNRWGFTCWQPVLAYGKNPYLARRLGLRPDVFMGNGERSSNKEHPCAKPMGVMRWMVERATAVPGTTVLDPFTGSGTTGVACIETGRNFIGCEIDPGYVEIARRRIAEAAARPMLEGIK
jgi:site-specific DNA-methyltransferase (adenine-specific)/modification methylase